MTRERAREWVEDYYDSGRFEQDLAARVAVASTSQEPAHRPDLYRYLDGVLQPAVEAMGYQGRIYDNPVAGGGPFLIAERHEGDHLPTVLTYGHGDVVRGQEDRWSNGRSPWKLQREGDRLYGRGTADNKGQHSINMAALAAVLAVRGQLGFNSRLLFETSEETGSLGLREFAAAERERLSADVLIASDGPRLQPEQPTLFMGTRGALNFTLRAKLREGGHHSGNWGGVLPNPATILSHALSQLISAKGAIVPPELKPARILNSVRMALAGLQIDGGDNADAKVDADWGEPGLTPAERVFAWNTLEILAFKAGDPDKVVNAIPPEATAWCQIRFTVDRDPDLFLPAIRHFLDNHGFDMVEVAASPDDTVMQATRLLPDHPWAEWAKQSLQNSTDKEIAVLPNLGGSLPNDVFTDVIGVPTLWVPHSYAACQQHAPNEHMLGSIAREGLQLMAGLFWDLGRGETLPGGQE